MTGAPIGFFVPGIPVPKGSARGFPIRRKNGHIGVTVTADNSNLRLWHASVQDRALDVCRRDQISATDAPVSVLCEFYLPAPKKYLKRLARGECIPHVTRPDLDKLERAVLDGMTGILFRDDSQVIKKVGTKQYPGPGQCVGVWIWVMEVEQSPALSDEMRVEDESSLSR